MDLARMILGSLVVGARPDRKRPSSLEALARTCPETPMLFVRCTYCHKQVLRFFYSKLTRRRGLFAPTSREGCSRLLTSTLESNAVVSGETSQTRAFR